MIKQDILDSYQIRAKEIVDKMSLSEKISQLRHHSKAIRKYNIPEYNWWNECLHGVARAGLATVFPQAIAMASTFSAEILNKVGDIISTEARAKHHDFVRNGSRGIYQGLTFWSPNINIFRDPRWGRGQETYGEDPYLTSVLGTSFIKGLQGDDDKYLKVSACAKHYAVHSGPESQRHSFNAQVNQKDLHETYLRAFECAVKEANVESIMTAYNRVNGEACACSKTLLQDILRDKWQFKGHVVSDCGGVGDIIFNHKITYNPLKGVALAIKAGLDLECGTFFSMLPMATRLGYAKPYHINQALIRLLTTRFKLGMFDNNCKYSNIPINVVASKEHEDYAISVAEKSIVLLKNDNVLPLTETHSQIGLFGYNATNEIAYLGNYYGTPSNFINTYDGLRSEFGENIVFSTAFPICGNLSNVQQHAYNQALELAKNCQYNIVCTGIDSTLEGEAGDVGAGKDGIIGEQGDRNSINLPQIQVDFIKDLTKFGKPIIVLNFSGSCINFSPIINDISALLQCWYPGAKGGKAIANIIRGKSSPSGKLPITFYASDNDLGDYHDYSMDNKTYRYFNGAPLFPFGYGLSYANIKCINHKLSSNNFKDCDEIELSYTIINNSSFTADEVNLLYVKYPKEMKNQPISQLIKFNRITLLPNETAIVTFRITRNDFITYNNYGNKEIVPGKYTLSLGNSPIEFLIEIN